MIAIKDTCWMLDRQELLVSEVSGDQRTCRCKYIREFLEMFRVNRFDGPSCIIRGTNLKKKLHLVCRILRIDTRS